jgi:hypothetical protein
MSNYNSADIINTILTLSNNKSSLTALGLVSDSYKSMCIAIGESIAAAHNTWQQSAIINNIIVNGGSCPPQGPLSSGIGVGVGSIIGRLFNTVNFCMSKFPTDNMTSRTPALSSHIQSIAEAFQETFNNFLDVAVLNNIEVSGGTCTCQIVPPGIPIPGSYFGGIGTLTKLEGNLASIPLSKNVMKTLAISKMDSNILAEGLPTLALDESLDAIFEALEIIHKNWLSSTSIQNIIVSGGLTFPGSPIVAAMGVGGKFI